MAVKDLATLQSDIESLFADNSAGAISAADLRTFLTDLTDTAENRWGPGALASSPAMSPSMSEAAARIAGLLADCPPVGSPEVPGTGCISPADLRGAVSPVIDLFYPKT